MALVWDNLYDCEPERTDIYILELIGSDHSVQVSKVQLKKRFTYREFMDIMDGVHPIWTGYKLK